MLTTSRMSRGTVRSLSIPGSVFASPPEEHALHVRKALKIMGYDTHTAIRDGKTYILPGEIRQTAREPKPKKHDDRER